MSDLNLQSFYITESKTQLILNQDGTIYTNETGQPVKMSGPITSAVIGLVGLAVNVTATAMSLKHQKELLEAQQRYVAMKTAQVAAMVSIFGGYNDHAFYVKQHEIAALMADLGEKNKKLSGFTFTSEEKRLGGLINNGFEELANNGFSNGIVNGFKSFTEYMSGSFSNEMKAERMDVFCDQLAIYGLKLCIDPYHAVNTKKYLFHALPISDRFPDDFETNKLPPMLKWKNQHVTDTDAIKTNVGLTPPQKVGIFYSNLEPEKGGNKAERMKNLLVAASRKKNVENFGVFYFDLLDMLRGLGSPAWIYRAIFNNKNAAFYSVFSDTDFSPLALFEAGYNQSKSDFTTVLNFVNGYNKYSYEEAMIRMEFKADPISVAGRLNDLIKSKSFAKSGKARVVNSIVSKIAKETNHGKKAALQNTLENARAEYDAMQADMNFWLDMQKQVLAAIEKAKTATTTTETTTDHNGTKTEPATTTTETNAETVAKIKAANAAKMQAALHKTNAAKIAAQNSNATTTTTTTTGFLTPALLAVAAGGIAYKLSKGSTK